MHECPTYTMNAPGLRALPFSHDAAAVGHGDAYTQDANERISLLEVGGSEAQRSSFRLKNVRERFINVSNCHPGGL